MIQFCARRGIQRLSEMSLLVLAPVRSIKWETSLPDLSVQADALNRRQVVSGRTGGGDFVYSNKVVVVWLWGRKKMEKDVV